MTYALLPISLATLYVTWRLVDLTGSLIAGCTCRKGAWNPTCPRHGRGSRPGPKTR